MPDVSVIVPTLNESKVLKKCLKSIKSQKTHLDYELVIVDGASTDNTLEVAEKYADKIITMKKKGIWRARNAGAKKAKSNYYCFVDADTWIPKNYLSSTYPVISGDSSIGALSCAFNFDKKSKTIKMVEIICNNYLALKGLMGKGEILGFNNLISKTHFKRTRGFPNKPLEDGALSIKMRKIGKVVYLTEPRVVTSARRLTDAGLLKTTAYYAGLSIATNVPVTKLKKVFSYKKVS